MKGTLAQLALGTLIAIVISSCWVDRRTGDFACGTDNDCLSFTPPRRCDVDLGYCVPGDNPNGCPEICNAGCNKGQMTCAISCGNGTLCDGEIACPEGWDCTIDCATGSCDMIHCRPGADCTINCVGGGACGDIECGDGDCTILCNGGGACGNIDCNDSKCDVTCSGGGACPAVDCDTACSCDVACGSGSSCGNVDCPVLACELPMGGCDSARTNCPNTCT